MSNKVHKTKEKMLLSVIPNEPEKIRANELYEKAKAKGVGQVTAGRHLKTLSKEGRVKRLQEGPKKVYYQKVEESKAARAARFNKYLEAWDDAEIRERACAFAELFDTPVETFYVFKDGVGKWIPTTPELKQAAENSWLEREGYARDYVDKALKKRRDQ